MSFQLQGAAIRKGKKKRTIEKKKKKKLQVTCMKGFKFCGYVFANTDRYIIRPMEKMSVRSYVKSSNKGFTIPLFSHFLVFWLLAFEIMPIA